jgi:hypothetical protein
MVEGIASYYPRFGFEQASALGFISPHPKIPDDAFMVKRLPGYSPDLAGRIVYPAAFDARSRRSWSREAGSLAEGTTGSGTADERAAGTRATDARTDCTESPMHPYDSPSRTAGFYGTKPATAPGLLRWTPTDGGQCSPQ